MRRMFKLFSILFGVIFAGSLMLLFWFHSVYQESKEEYADLAREAVQVRKRQDPAKEQAEPEEVPPLLSVNFEELKTQNEEVCAWIDFPGQEKSYPVVQTDNNEYYLNHSFRRGQSICGSIFADSRNSGILTDDNTILYGHNMRNDSMFGFLSDYLKEEHWKEYPYFDLYLPETTYRCRIFACLRVKADWSNFPIQFEREEAEGENLDPLASSSREREEFIQRMKQSCPYPTMEQDSEERPLIMLSTCTGRGHTHRLVVLAEAYEQ